MNEPLPPPNPALRWYRLVLWLMPTCIAFTTFIALDSLITKAGVSRGAWLIGWMVFNFTAAYLLGIFDRKVCGSKLPPDKVFPHATAFLALQILLVPVLLGTAAMPYFWISS